MIGNQITPLINGKAWEYADIIVNILGVPINEITSIEYSQNQQMKNNYGAGRWPVSYGYGPMEISCKLTMSMNEVENLYQAIVGGLGPGACLQDIPPFDIIIFFGDSAIGAVTHTIKNCRIMNDERRANHGDTTILVDLNILPSNIIFA